MLKRFTSERIFFYIIIIILGQTIRERKMKEPSRKKNKTKSGKKHCDWKM